jgi:hypothetical protein
MEESWQLHVPSDLVLIATPKEAGWIQDSVGMVRMGIRPEPDGNRIQTPQAVATMLTELPCLLLNANNYCATGYGVGAFEALVHGSNSAQAQKETVLYGDPPCSESCEVPERFILKNCLLVACYRRT